MNEKAKEYVAKVIGHQLGHNPALKDTPFKNTVNSTDILFDELGCTQQGLVEIAIRISDELHSRSLYGKILNAFTVGDIENAVIAAGISEDAIESIINNFDGDKFTHEKPVAVEQAASSIPNTTQIPVLA